MVVDQEGKFVHCSCLMPVTRYPRWLPSGFQSSSTITGVPAPRCSWFRTSCEVRTALARVRRRASRRSQWNSWRKLQLRGVSRTRKTSCYFEFGGGGNNWRWRSRMSHTGLHTTGGGGALQSRTGITLKEHTQVVVGRHTIIDDGSHNMHIMWVAATPPHSPDTHSPHASCIILIMVYCIYCI